MMINKKVGNIIDNPFNPKINPIPGLSIKKDVNIIEIVNAGIEKIKFFLLMKLMYMINKPKSIIKNWFPPHADKLTKIIIPEKIFFMIDRDKLFEFNAERNNQNPSNPRNKPKGSDLNQPAEPLTRMGMDTEKNRAESNPADVPIIFLVIPKIIKIVNEPTITGKIIV